MGHRFVRTLNVPVNGMTAVHTIDGEFGMSQRIGTIVIHSGPLFDGC